MNVQQPLGIYHQMTGGLLVFKDVVIQRGGVDWTVNGMKGIGIGAAGAGEIYHLLISDDIEWVEEVTGTGNLTLSNPYRPGSHDLWVFRAGQGKQRLTDHYTEVDTTTVNVSVNDTYIFVKFQHNFWRDRITLAGATLGSGMLALLAHASAAGSYSSTDASTSKPATPAMT